MEGDTVAVPLLPLRHVIFVPEIIAARTAGCVIITLAVAVQPFTPVTVTVHVPAVKPVHVAVVCAGAGSFHKYV